MKKTEIHIELIEKYIEGKLDHKAFENFEKELKVNISLAQQVEQYKKVIRGLKEEGLRSQLKEYHNELFNKPKTPRKIKWYYYAGVAASVLLLISSIYILFIRPVSSKKLYDTYFEPYPNLVTTRSNSTTKFERAMENYSHGYYKKAIVIFSEISQTDSVYIEALYYKGISLLALDLPSEAINTFEQLKNNEPYKEQLAWYLAMAYFRHNDIENTRKQLLKIEERSFKYTEAQELLEQLKD